MSVAALCVYFRGGRSMEKTTTVACSFKRSNWRKAVQCTLEVARLPGSLCWAHALRVQWAALTPHRQKDDPRRSAKHWDGGESPAICPAIDASSCVHPRRYHQILRD